MMHITMLMENTFLIATRSPGEWHGTCYDTQTGKSIPFTWTDNEFEAIVALMIGDEDRRSEEMTSRLYEIAEPLIKNWPPEVRPIP